MVIINLGCGRRLLYGAINVDVVPVYGQEVITDVVQGLPFRSESVDLVLTYHFMEHIPSGKPLIGVIKEIWRVLRVGGRWVGRSPHSGYMCAFLPDHCSYWNEYSIFAIATDPYHSGGTAWEVMRLSKRGTEVYWKLKKKGKR